MDHSSSSLSPPHQSYFPFYPSPPPPHPTAFNLNNKVSPSMLLIIIILAVIFFISGVLHLLVRFLLRPPSRDPDQDDAVTALQGQLQQLFHLHDAGVDQSFIDALPVFNYRAIIGVKDPFDCAVCLCEFESEDKLRLLPKCSHAFHMDCIDTWLLSHSTCPICRASLLADFPASCNSPVVLVLESGSESSREISHNTLERDIAIDTSGSGGDGVSSGDLAVKTQSAVTVPSKEEGERVVSVKLGKFRSVDSGGGGDPTGDNADARRCFSMGSFAYMMDESSSLQVPIRTPMKKLSSKKPSALPLTPGHRPAVSECGGDSRREFNGLEAFKIVEIDDNRGDGDDDDSSNRNGKAIGRSKKESFSVSKIWLRGRNKEKSGGGGGEDKMGSSSSRRAFSFRFPMNRSAATGDETKVRNGRRTVSEINMSRWGSELGEEIESCNGLDPQANYPTSSLARRTLLWIMGRPNKVVNHSSISNTNV